MMDRLVQQMEQQWSLLCEAAAARGTPLQLPDIWDADFSAPRLLDRDRKLGAPTQISPNGSCRILRCADGWIAANLPREEDWQAVPAWLEDHAENWEEIAQICRDKKGVYLRERAALLHLPVSICGEAQPQNIGLSGLYDVANSRPKKLRVADLSSLWAGPLCGALLAAQGHDVVKLESETRPDKSDEATPLLGQRLNGQKTRKYIRLTRDNLAAYLRDADMVITSARPHALARLGLDDAALTAHYPDLLWIAISGHGMAGDNAMRVGFGDDCAAAGGLLCDDGPQFIGDALADPLTGLLSAQLAAQALLAGKAGRLDIGLANVAAYFRGETQRQNA